MDPGSLTSPLWNEIGNLLSSLWLMVLFIVFFATNMLIGHNMIPSLVASRHISDSLQKTRPIFYALAIISFGLAIFFLSRAVGFSGVLRGFWEDYWI